MPQTIKRRNDNWVGHIFRRNGLLKHVTEGQTEGTMEVMERRGRRRKQLLDDLRDKWGYRKLNEKTVDSTVCRTRFGRCYGLAVRQKLEDERQNL